jgi:hypothetical protein
MRAKPKGAKYRNLTEPDLEEIERLAREKASETYRAAVVGSDARKRGCQWQMTSEWRN